MRIDLHIHTTYSDGEYTPLEILQLCNQRRVKIISITDHNNIEGAKEAIRLNPYHDIQVVSGIEFSARYDKKGGQLHILGYDIDLENEQLNSITKEMMKDSIRRVESLVFELKKEFGLTFSDKDISEMLSSYGNIGRPEVAKLCVKYGYTSSVDEAFKRYFEPVNDKLVKKNISLTGKECIELIIQAGGIPCLAHPILLKKNLKDIKDYIKFLVTYGLQGVEVYHSLHTEEFSKELLKIVDEYGLVYSVGSDYHGPIVTPNYEIGSGQNNNIANQYASILSKLER